MTDKAVIWDLDGVIVDSAPQHFAAWRHFCARHGRSLSEEEFRATFGQRNEEILRRFFGDALPEAEKRQMADEKERLFRQAVARGISVLPGAIPLIQALKKAGFAQAIGSSTPRANITLLLDRLAIAPYFEATIAAEDVSNGKPDPEIFQRAADWLGIAPGCCVVIEDAVAGVAAAKAAGATAIAVTNTRDRQALAEADLVVDSLLEVDVSLIERLVTKGRAPKNE